MPARSPKRVLFASPWWHAAIVNGVLRHAAQRGWHMNLNPCLTGRVPERWDGDGIVTQLGGDLADQQRLLERSRCPAVSLNGNFPQIEVPRVTLDDRATGRLAAEHLIERGFRHFAFYSHGLSPDSSRRRREAYTETLAAAGHQVEVLAWRDETQRHAEAWQERQRWLCGRLRALPKPAAVLAVNDEAAVEVIEACLAESIAIPDQAAVLGVLNMDIFRQCTPVSLSSIAFDFDQLTGAACDLLDAMMQGEPPPEGPILFPPTEVKVRQSTDTYAAQSPVVSRAIRYMLDHFDQDISVEAIQREVHRSRAGLFKAFKSDLGQTPGQVLSRIRMDRAKRMLIDSDAKVYAVAEACGFGSPVTLHRVFKQHLGQSPNAFRKTHHRAHSPPQRG